MANTDRPHGFDPYGAIRALNKFKCDTTTTAIFKGDVVDAIASGYVGPAAAQSTQVVGASVGYQAVYGTAGTYEIGVYDDPDQMYVAQGDAACSRATINQLCNHIASAGSTVTLLSGHQLDISTATTSTTTLGWRLLDYIKNEENDWTLDSAEIVCTPNYVARHYITAGV